MRKLGAEDWAELAALQKFYLEGVKPAWLVVTPMRTELLLLGAVLDLEERLAELAGRLP